ncbi:MAG: hypothetical protein M3R16_06350 [Pseudomonadota bacterium]|nr:hypothetical protein [Pseudomonadota bacterium]
MKIKFTNKDPRRGMVVEMEEGLARQLIDAGSATDVSGSKAESAAPQNKAQAAAPQNKAVKPITAPVRTATVAKKATKR